MSNHIYNYEVMQSKAARNYDFYGLGGRSEVGVYLVVAAAAVAVVLREVTVHWVHPHESWFLVALVTGPPYLLPLAILAFGLRNCYDDWTTKAWLRGYHAGEDAGQELGAAAAAKRPEAIEVARALAAARLAGQRDPVIAAALRATRDELDAYHSATRPREAKQIDNEPERPSSFARGLGR